MNDCAGLVPGSEPLAPLRIAELFNLPQCTAVVGCHCRGKYQEWVPTRLKGTQVETLPW